MLSVCIPVYNHSFVKLATKLHKQCISKNIPFEIIIADDHSTDKIVHEDGIAFKALSNSIFIRNSTNLGNDQNRNLLAKKAQYPWLLFLDADTMPLDNTFITSYLNAIQDKPADAYSGGIVYGKLDNPNHILKWKHGKATEQISTHLDEDDFLGFRGNNFLIKRDVYLKVPFHKLPQKYGYQDTVFGINLKLSGYNLKLIHNPVLHLGLMDGVSFIEKTEEAISYVLYLENHFPEIAEKIKLIKAYRKLDKIGLRRFLASIFKRSKTRLYQNLISNNPTLFYFKLYKLGYLCLLSLSQSNQTDER